MEGRATAVRGTAVGMLGDGREQERRLGRFAARAAGLAATEVIPGSAAPWIRARHCRAKIGGAAEPATSAVSASGRRHVSPLPRHHARRGTGIWPHQDNRRGQKC